MNARDLYNAVLGFNTTEKNRTGQVISWPVRPVALLLSGGFPTQQRITHFQQLIELLKMSAIKLIWQYDQVAVEVILPQQYTTRKAQTHSITINYGQHVLKTEAFPVTLHEDFRVPPEVIDYLRQKANRF